MMKATGYEDHLAMIYHMRFHFKFMLDVKNGLKAINKWKKVSIFSASAHFNKMNFHSKFSLYCNEIL